MKNYYLFLLGILLSVGSSAQALLNDTTLYFDGAIANWNLDGRRIVTQRNSNGLEQTAVEQAYDSENELWTDSRRYTTVYQSDNTSILSYKEEVWNTASDSWVELNYKQYDTNGNLLLNENRTWDAETNQFVEGWRNVSTFENNHQTTLYFDTLDAENNVWLHLTFSGYTYNSDGLLSEKTIQRFNGTSWYDHSMILFEYDLNENLTEETGYLYQDDKAWAYSYRLFYEYNDNDQQTDFYYNMHNGSVWEPVLWHQFAYHSNGEKDEHILSFWENDAWEPDTRESWYFNDDNSYDYILTETYSGSWVNDKKISYIYDDQSRLETISYTDWIGIGWEPDRREHFEYEGDYLTAEYSDEFVFSVWVNDRRTEYAWYDPTLSVHDMPAEIKLYPNPCSDYLHINAEGDHFLLLFSLTGEQLKADTFHNNCLLDVSDLATGVYILQIDNTSYKFVRQ